MEETYKLSNGTIATKEIIKKNDIDIVTYKVIKKEKILYTCTFDKECIIIDKNSILGKLNYSNIAGINYECGGSDCYIKIYGKYPFPIGAATVLSFIANYEIYEEIKQILNKKGIKISKVERHGKIRKLYDDFLWKILIGICIIIFIILFIEICLNNSSKSKSDWDKLSDTEKEWYDRNYGNGKMEDINNAIKNYRGY